jgi:hypothetical protein
MLQETHNERMNKANSFIGFLLLFLVMLLFYGNSSMSIKRLRVFPTAHIRVPNKSSLASRSTDSFGLPINNKNLKNRIILCREDSAF